MVSERGLFNRQQSARGKTVLEALNNVRVDLFKPVVVER